jgi:hypothetical protein
MTFTDWDVFTSEFVSMCCPENEATTVLMQLESECYFQGRHNIEENIEFKDLIDMWGYTNPISSLRSIEAYMQ